MVIEMAWICFGDSSAKRHGSWVLAPLEQSLSFRLSTIEHHQSLFKAERAKEVFKPYRGLLCDSAWEALWFIVMDRLGRPAITNMF